MMREIRMEMDVERLTAFLTPLKSQYIHASNILTKLSKRLAPDVLDFLLQCGVRYKTYSENFNAANIERTVSAWNEYSAFVRMNNKNNKYFTSQSKFESSILEESLFRLFSDFADNSVSVTSDADAYSNLYFSPLDFTDFKKATKIKLNTKNQDFAICKQVEISVRNANDKNETPSSVTTYVPIIAIECKTYLDKTMLEGSVATAEKIKNGNPYCRFCIVAERYEVDKRVDISHSRIDQIYVLKKDAKNNDADIAFDVVQRLYDDTLAYLKRKWSDVESNIKINGTVL